VLVHVAIQVGSVDDRVPQPAGSTGKGTLADPAGLLPGFQALFFGTSGVVDLNACAEGTRAWGGDQGFFTRGLTSVLLEICDEPNVTLAEAYGRIKSATASRYRSWRKGELRRLQSLGSRSGAEENCLRALIDQVQQTSQAYYLTGTELKIVALAEKKVGIVVAELPRDSPVRDAGVKPGDVILRVQEQNTPTLEVWQETIGTCLQAGHRRITLSVRSPGGKPRDVNVDLPK